MSLFHAARRDAEARMHEETRFHAGRAERAPIGAGVAGGLLLVALGPARQALAVRPTEPLREE